MASNGNASAGAYLYEGQPDVPNDVICVRFHPSVREIPQGAFTKCKQLKKVELNDGLEVIGKSAFESCYRLMSIAFPSTVRLIEEKAFASCSGCGFKTIVLPPHVESIGKEAFLFCEGIKSVELNEGLKTISDGAFQYCYQLQSISFPSTLERIGDWAFSNSDLRAVKMNEGLKNVGRWAFRECSLQTVAVPSTVSKIGGAAFEDCSDLKSVELSSGLKYIDYDAFKGCTSLARIRFPPTVRAIWIGAFEGCTGLRSVELVEEDNCQNKCLRIGVDAFAGCESLLSFRLPSDIKRGAINRGAFHSCPHLRNVILARKMGQASFNRAFASLYFIDYSFDELLERFNEMPIHELCHYRSNLPTDPDSLQRVVDERSLSYRHQDCLGMTPLHILACSCNNNMDLYKIVVERFPSYLVTKDKWSKVPLYYALVGEAPSDVLKFLFGAHRDVWGGLPFDFADMVKQLLSNKGTTVNFMHRLFEAHRSVFPDIVLNLKSIVLAEGAAAKAQAQKESKAPSNAVGRKKTDLVWSVLIASFSERIRKNDCLPPLSESVSECDDILCGCGDGWSGRRYYREPMEKLVAYAGTIWRSMAKLHPRKSNDESSGKDEALAGEAPFPDPDLAWEQIVDNLCFVDIGTDMPIPIYQGLVGVSLAHRLGNIQHREAIEAMIAAMPDHTLETDFLMGDPGGKKRFQRALRRHVQSIRIKVRLYELHEAAGILEMALWKTQIRNAEANNQEVDRAACRVRCGADIVIPGAVAYLKD